MKTSRTLALAAVGLLVLALALVAAGAVGGWRLVGASDPAQDTADGPTFRFGAVGDHGSNAHSRAVLRSVGARNPDLFLSLGDLSYDTLSGAAWCQMVKEEVNAGAGRPAQDPFGQTYPFAIVKGNHDSAILDEVLGPSCLPDRLGATESGDGTYGEQYYLDYPAADPLVRFILTSPGVGRSYTVGSEPYTWLSSTILDARATGIPWVVVGNHMNYVTSGAKSNETGPDYFNLLVSTKVDLVLQAHDHTYQRTKQLALGDGCAAIPTGTVDEDCIVDDGSDLRYAAGAGTVTVINGAGGHSAYPVSPTDRESGYFARAHGDGDSVLAGYTEFLVSETGISATYVGAGGSGMVDSFTIGTPPADTTAPGAASGLLASGVDGGSVDLAWSGATDDQGVASYRVVRDGVMLPDVVTTTAFRDTGLTAGQTYQYSVRAFDVAGNIGLPSMVVAATVP